MLQSVALKSQSRSILKSFDNKASPTAVFQAHDGTLFVGTEGGKIECWSLENSEISTTINAHEESAMGISQIRELKTPGELITRDKNSDKRFLVTTAFDKPEFKIWTLSNDAKCELQPHIMIRTSFTDGICFVLESSPTQLVCVDTDKTLKFYDFRHE